MPLRRAWSILSAAAALLLLPASFGCTPQPAEAPMTTAADSASDPASPPSADERGEPAAGAQQPAQASPADVTLEPVGAERLAGAVAGHRGEVVLVDFWATWCGPCVAMFPHTVELHREFEDRGLAVISVSMDAPEQRSQVRAFLVEQGATFENYLSRYGIGAKGFEAFDIDDGALPHVKLFDRRGKLHRVFSAGGAAIDLDELDREVERLLEEPAADG